MTSFDLKRSRLFRTSNFLEIFSSILNSKVLNFKTDLKSHDREAGFYKTYACEGQWPYLFVQNWASIFFENYRGTCEKCRVDNLRFIIGVSTGPCLMVCRLIVLESILNQFLIVIFVEHCQSCGPGCGTSRQKFNTWDIIFCQIDFR